MKTRFLALSIAICMLTLCMPCSAVTKLDRPLSVLVMGDEVALGTGLAEGEQSFSDHLGTIWELDEGKNINIATLGLTPNGATTYFADNATAMQNTDYIVLSAGQVNLVWIFLALYSGTSSWVGSSYEDYLPTLRLLNALSPEELAAKMTSSNYEMNLSFLRLAIRMFLDKFDEIQISKNTQFSYLSCYNPVKGVEGYETISYYVEEAVNSVNQVAYDWIQEKRADGYHRYRYLDLNNALSINPEVYLDIANNSVFPTAQGHEYIAELIDAQLSTSSIFSIPAVGSYTKPDTSMVISLDITWGSFLFTYNEGTIGQWDPETHSYVNAITRGWHPETVGSDVLKVENRSNIALRCELSCELESGFEGVTATFTADGSNSFRLSSAVGQSEPPAATVRLAIEGIPPNTEATQPTRLGKVSMIIYTAYDE